MHGTCLLKKCLQEKFFLFKELDSESQSKMIDAMSKVDSVELRQVIMNQGDEGDFMYVIESGSYEVSVDGSKVASLRKGEIFGELALLYQCPRAATIRCSEAPAQYGNLKEMSSRT